MDKIKIIALVAAVVIGGVAVREYYKPKIVVAKAIEKARVIEQKIAVADNHASVKYQKELENGKLALQDANDRLRAELARVRRARPKSLPVDTTCDSRRDDASPVEELSEGNREKLIAAIERFGARQFELAADADADAAQIVALQQQLTTRIEDTK